MPSVKSLSPLGLSFPFSEEVETRSSQSGNLGRQRHSPRIQESPKISRALCPAILRQAELIRLWVARRQHSGDSDEVGGASLLSCLCFRAMGAATIWATGSQGPGRPAFISVMLCSSGRSGEATQSCFARFRGKNASLVGRRPGLSPLLPPSWLPLKLIPEKHYFTFSLKGRTADILSGLSQSGGGAGHGLPFDWGSTTTAPPPPSHRRV